MDLYKVIIRDTRQYLYADNLEDAVIMGKETYDEEMCDNVPVELVSATLHMNCLSGKAERIW